MIYVGTDGSYKDEEKTAYAAIVVVKDSTPVWAVRYALDSGVSVQYRNAVAEYLGCLVGMTLIADAKRSGVKDKFNLVYDFESIHKLLGGESEPHKPITSWFALTANILSIYLRPDTELTWQPSHVPGVPSISDKPVHWVNRSADLLGKNGIVTERGSIVDMPVLRKSITVTWYDGTLAEMWHKDLKPIVNKLLELEGEVA